MTKWLPTRMLPPTSTPTAEQSLSAIASVKTSFTNHLDTLTNVVAVNQKKSSNKPALANMLNDFEGLAVLLCVHLVFLFSPQAIAQRLYLYMEDVFFPMRQDELSSCIFVAISPRSLMLWLY